MKFSVIIATSQNRTGWLINRSLKSVYRQIGIDKSDFNIFVVDDNENESEFYVGKRCVEYRYIRSVQTNPKRLRKHFR